MLENYLFEILTNLAQVCSFLGWVLGIAVLWHLLLKVVVDNVKPLPKWTYVVAIIAIFISILVPNRYTWERIQQVQEQNNQLTKENIELQTQLTQYQIKDI